MKLNDFKLEVFFGKHEFTAPYLLTQSDCESMSVRELLAYEPGAEELLLNGWLGYTEVSGNPELREIISKLYQRIEAEDIIVHVGAQEAIFNFLNVCLDEGDHMISQFPIYQSLYEVANSIGCEVSKWTLKQADNGWVMDYDELERLIKPNTKLICINSPNNPTGYTFTAEEMERIADIAHKNDIYVFCDEVYKGIELDGVKRPWFADIYEKGISLGVMSKAYGLAGLRIGWVAAKDKEILEKMVKMKHYTSICSSSSAEELAIVALKHSDEILERNRKIIEANLKIADKFFQRYPRLFKYNRPTAGPIAFHKMNIETPIGQFCDQLVEEKGVLLLPADMYAYDGQYFRMGYGRASFETSLKVFEEYLIEKGLV
ncbi:aspartate aminotransferase AspC [Clostridium aceticum]|uniref:Aspartate aminotransferase AspC n=1 Tax=Clostridium aceticum TaxID=84022 RepID=A0A0D8IB51_9CLOT|nr:aminotransferase class I/II-fold pyridoxal phosphate-dependent enzyme [Clostridium aceticum]AKL96524.1 aspartate aminotransferase AspC [Clostridium aceticum]KJF27309.1 aspartate/tyrosine/aromatic aminotransferase [Clostridium aceticum]